MSELKLLIINSNNAVTMDLFNHFSDDFLMLSCSTRYDDISNHLAVLSPQVMLLAVADDPEDEVKSLSMLKRFIAKNNIAFAILGSDIGCNNFQRQTSGMADIEIVKPFHYDDIEKSLKSLIDEKAYLKKQQDETRNSAASSDAGGADDPDRRKCILVIDDDPMMLRVVKKYLADTYEVATTVSATAAYKYLTKAKVDLILLDYQMPEENGPEVLKKLRANSETGKIPVIFLTGVKDREKIQEVLSLHPQGYMLKPVDREKLLGTLDSFFGRGK